MGPRWPSTSASAARLRRRRRLRAQRALGARSASEVRQLWSEPRCRGRKPPNLNGRRVCRQFIGRLRAARGVCARAPAYLAATRPGRAARTLARRRASWSRQRAGGYQATQRERGAQNGKLSVQWLDGAKWAAASRVPRTKGEGSSPTPPCVRTSPTAKKAPRQCRCRIPALPPLHPPLAPCCRCCTRRRLPTGVVVPNVPTKSHADPGMRPKRHKSKAAQVLISRRMGEPAFRRPTKAPRTISRAHLPRGPLPAHSGGSLRIRRRPD